MVCILLWNGCYEPEYYACVIGHSEALGHSERDGRHFVDNNRKVEDSNKSSSFTFLLN